MLRIENIRKKYVTGELVQTALDGVSLTLRDNEFVAILGPSGSGKTTLLNVIGGLDRYDSGDLVINGISTKKYTDRDWDSYRNHTIGFVFQSYNLIPHQTVLANVELALTISGISRSERRKRAAKALEEVGLGNQLHKKPNQMSGGQMQRVAIARALVNDPDILLADEPTGALDSETSVQVMELLKKVADDRLVVMVTHNPELAEEYANRIVRVKDGKIIDDTNPYEVELQEQEPPRHKSMGRSSMSFLTSLSLSFNNLLTKKARTLLTAFAGSIGIIGIALIMSLSTGFQKYIDKIQEDTLSNYPLTIQSETADMAAAMAAMGAASASAQNAEQGTVVEQPVISQMFAQIGTNDLASFKVYLDENMDVIGHTINAIKYSYGIKPLIFAEDTTDGVLQVNPGVLFADMMGNSMMAAYMDSDIFHEMLDNFPMLNSQYDVLQGRWPENYNELVFVLSSPNQIPDYTAYTLGLKDPAELNHMIQQVMSGEEPENVLDPMSWTYDDLMGLRFRLVNASDLYRYNAEYGVWEDMSGDLNHMRRLVEQGEELRIVGIVCPKEGVSATTLSSGICYLPGLTHHVIDMAAESELVKSQLADRTVNVFTGVGFEEEKQDSQLNFENMISVDGDMITSAFGMNIDPNAVMAMMSDYLRNEAGSLNVDTSAAQADFLNTFQSLGKDMLYAYIEANGDGSGGARIQFTDAQNIVSEYLSTETAQQQMQLLADWYQLPVDTFRGVYQPLLTGLITSCIASEMAPEQPEQPEETEPSEPLPDVTEPSEEETTVPSETTLPPETTAPQESTPNADPEAEEPAAQVVTTAYYVAPVEDAPVLDESLLGAVITQDRVEYLVAEYMKDPVVTGTAAVMGSSMMQTTVRQMLAQKVAEFGNVLMRYIGSSFYVDEQKLASAFQFNMSEEDLRRLMEAMSGRQQEINADSNLRLLGYADLDNPVGISVYMVDFAAKEEFLAFLDGYNADMEAAGKEEQVISYTDVTGIMMSSVRTIIDSVSYVLIAFVAVSLVVSSIMIGIITYISVMERTKEIGVLRAIGASKRNISQVFNAETFIIGLCSGLIGVGITLLLNIPINEIIHALTDNPEIKAQLPAANAAILVVLSMLLTLIGGLIPAKQAAKKDPVIALRSE